MRALGCCHGPDSLDAPALHVFTYREVTLSVLEVAAEEGKDVARYARGLRPPIAVVMGVFPPTMPLLGDSADREAIRRRADFVAHLVGRAGVERLVFGAGKIRSIPEGMSRSAGLAALAGVLGHLGEACARRGVELVLENRPAGASNVFNTVGEIVEFLDAHGLDDIAVVFDLKAAALQGEDLQTLERHRARVHHVHLPFPAPDHIAGAPSVVDAVRALVAIGYRSTISIEPDGLAISAAVAEFGRHVEAVWHESEATDHA